mgnify:CR=1 FL=1
MSDNPAEYAELPRSPYLDNALRRARTAAEQRSHRYVTLEHLLLALLDDPDAIGLLEATGADVPGLQSMTGAAVNHRMAALVDPSGRPPSFSHKFDSLFIGASEDAISLGRGEVCGAFALIAVAKDPESNASAILAANGFYPQAALQALAAALEAPPRPPSPPQAPPPAYQAVPAPEPQAAPLPPSDAQSSSGNDGPGLVEDMLVSARDILDAEERRQRGPEPPPSPQAPQSRREPQLRAEAPPDRASKLPPQAPRQRPDHLEPGPSLEPRPAAPAGPALEHRAPDRGPAMPARRPEPGFASPGPALPDAPESRRKGRGRQPSARGKEEPPGVLARVLEALPRKMRAGQAELVQIRLTKEDAGRLLARAPRRGQPQPAGEAPPVCRAIAMRLSAPEGGLFIETSQPETQWLADLPSFLGDEPFGAWAWTVIASESGPAPLSLSISAREVDANGVPAAYRLPEQTVKVRVLGNPRSRLWSIARGLLWLLTGSALAAGAIYVLGKTGTLPHWFIPR